MANRKARMRRNKVNSDIRREGRALEAPKIKKDPMRSLDDEQGMSLQRRARMGARPVSMTGSYNNNLEDDRRKAPMMPNYDETEVDVSPRAEREEQMMLGKKYGGKVKKMKAGGKVRGAGIAQKGVRACQMR